MGTNLVHVDGTCISSLLLVQPLRELGADVFIISNDGCLALSFNISLFHLPLKQLLHLHDNKHKSLTEYFN